MKSLLSLLSEDPLSVVLAKAEAQVKAAPIDADKRAHWVQLLILQGEWERAQTQLNAWETLTPASRPIIQQLLASVDAERHREKVFCAETTPYFLTEPQTWLSTLAKALQACGANAYEERTLAYSLADESEGTLLEDGTDNQPHHFAWLADADSRLGPVCELLIDNHYYWVPFNEIASITFQKPMNIVHLVWRHALIKLRSGLQKVCQIPARYPITSESSDSHRLCHRTDWFPLDDSQEHYSGQGQKSWLTDGSEYPLLTLHQVNFTQDEN